MAAWPALAFTLFVAVLQVQAVLASRAGRSGLALQSKTSRTLKALDTEASDKSDSILAYPLAALRDQKRGVVRIYGSYSLSVVSNSSDHNERTQVSGCEMITTATGKQKTVEAEVVILDRLFEIEGSMFIDCKDSEPAADVVTLRLQDGTELGRRLKITLMDTERKGKLASCAGPLHTDRPWLRPWVEYYTLIGVERFIINVPLGAQVDELFTDKRWDRIENNRELEEHTPWSVGSERLKKFESKGLEWFEYYPSPKVPYYGQQLIYNACQYRLRYAYDYVMQFDIDEFFVLTGNVRPEYINFPQFLDANFPTDAASLTFVTEFYPLECRTRVTGLYPFQFSLRLKDLPGAAKAVTRPNAVANMHIHGVLDVTDEWKAKYPNWSDIANTAQVPLSKAFVKHIRTWQNKADDGKVHHPLCTFPANLGNSNAEWVVSY